MMESLDYPEFPVHLSVVHVALFTQIIRPSHLRERLINVAKGDQGDTEREAVNFAFINAHLITSRLHLQTAIYHAILAASQGCLRTKTVHSEVLWALNPTNNISEAIRRYGISDSSTALFVVRIASPSLTDVRDKMNAVVEGKMVPLMVLDQVTDWSLVKKYYKLDNERAIKNMAGDLDHEHAVIDNIVTSSVAMKSVMS